MAKDKNKPGFPFYAMLSRMKYINRWGLMRNNRGENIQEHSLQVAIIAHALALIRNVYFNGSVDADRAAVVAMFHDCDEILTGDLPTPVKYFNESILSAYREVGDAAKERLLSMLPGKLAPEYRALLYGGEGGSGDGELWQIIKAADTLCAYIKCLEEIAGGNTEFETAARSTLLKLEATDLPEVQIFLDEFIGAFSLSLDDYGI
jgi:5'-deoxynucleotidase